ncbi:hypothetical protein F2Q70_00008961 [Brassica cretica]|uniref:Uncharacterized protein n=1 Tax=Brassica cretica TaxID=69181 RepID=A0A8S9JCS9_BRACR|nr:hypothetical protein F2Q68_00002019 [Brassica cretica]KAF2609599.1 hypothetical protein F2Q70_00008961 [Brassica cretica]
MGLEGYFWKDSAKEVRDCFTFGSRSIAMGNVEHASTFVMSALWDWLQGSNRDDKGVLNFVKFCKRIGGYSDTKDMFSRV